jgi:hypothetical protein
MFWFKDNPREESSNLPAPEIIAPEITDDHSHRAGSQNLRPAALYANNVWP